MGDHEITDDQLIRNIKNDDYISYNHLFTRYYSRLCHFVTTISDRSDYSEDVVQEFFIKLWTNREKINIQTTVPGYLYRSVRNLTLNHIRSETNRKTMIGKIQQDDWYPDDDEPEFMNALENCINQLPARSREVLLMYRVQGFRQKEIADKLNISVKTIKNQIWSAMQRLKACLELKGL